MHHQRHADSSEMISERIGYWSNTKPEESKRYTSLWLLLRIGYWSNAKPEESERTSLQA